MEQIKATGWRLMISPQNKKAENDIVLHAWMNSDRVYDGNCVLCNTSLYYINESLISIIIFKN